MDSIEIKWIQHYHDVFRLEATACFREMFGGRWESPVAFFDSFHETLPDSDPKTIMTVGEGTPRKIVDMVDILAGTDQFLKFRADASGYPALRHHIVRRRRERGAGKRFTNAEKRRWLAELLPDQLNMTFGPVLIGDDMKRKFAELVDLTKCRAFRANWAFHEGANLDPMGARKSDIADLLHLTGVAYCDVAFADRRTVEALRKGNYDKLPKRNSEYPRWIRSLA